MGRKEIDPETANKIKQELAELREILEKQTKVVKAVRQKKSKASSSPPEFSLEWDDPDEKMPYGFVPLLHKSVPVCPPSEEDLQKKPSQLIKDIEFKLRDYVLKQFDNDENKLLKHIENDASSKNANTNNAKEILKHLKQAETSGFSNSPSILGALSFGNLLYYSNLKKTNFLMSSILQIVVSLRNNVKEHPNDPLFELDGTGLYQEFMHNAMLLLLSFFNHPKGGYILYNIPRDEYEKIPFDSEEYTELTYEMMGTSHLLGDVYDKIKKLDMITPEQHEVFRHAMAESAPGNASSVNAYMEPHKQFLQDLLNQYSEL